VVGLPDRADRAIDLPANALRSVSGSGEQVPDAGAEVRATEDRVQRHSDPEDHGANVGAAHAEASVGGVSGGGLEGISPPSWPDCQRRESPRRTTTAITPRAA